MNFADKLAFATQKNNSLLCIGLDPDPELMPSGIDIISFNKAIIDATCDLVCAYKLNFAFYEAIEDDGLEALKLVVQYIPHDVPIIGDAKRGDIGNTAKAYAKSIFVNYNFDATTVNPYLGFDSIEPFIQYKDKGVFILCRTSNVSAADFQSLHCELEYLPELHSESIYRPLFEIVALKVRSWNIYGNLGLVVGATYPDDLKLLRDIHPEIPILIPGIGTQGGDLASAVRYGVNSQGQRAIINSSRQIIYASREKDFAQSARSAALLMRNQINYYLSASTSSP
ncbi:orotidine-5'-phosphate decarboxylase [Chloroflexota bacterium]